jgi:hypothetical protein
VRRAVITRDVCAYRSPCYKAGEVVYVQGDRPVLVNGQLMWRINADPAARTMVQDFLPANAVTLA